MSRYKIEPFPAVASTGMLTGAMPPGVTITDLETGKSASVDDYREMHRNKAKALEILTRSAEKDNAGEQK